MEIAVAHSSSPYVSTYPWTGAFGTKISNPGTLPTGDGRDVSFTALGDYLAVAHITSPYVSAYPWTGAFGTKISNPGTLPTGNGLGVAFSPAGDAIVVGHSTTPFVSAYPWTGAFGSKIADPSTLPAGDCNFVAFTPSGNAVALAHGTSPFISVYPWSGSFGTKIPNPGTLPASVGNGVAFSPAGDAIVVAHVTTPFVSAYPWSGTFGTKISNPGTLPASNGLGVSFTPSGNTVALAHVNSPFVTAYPWSGAFGTKISDPGTLPTGNGLGIAFAPTGDAVAIAHSTTPFITAYPWTGSFGTKIANPGTLPASTGQDVAFRQSAGDLNVLHGATPVVSGQTTPIDFGRITAGDDEAQQTFTVQNLGEQTITISSVSVPAGFEIDAGSQIPAVGTTVLGGASKSLIVNLLAAAPGRKRGNITINSNDHDEPAYSFAVSGFVQVATTAEDLFADPSSLIGYHGYDSRGNQVLAIDPKGNTTVTVFDGASRPVLVQQHLRRRGQGSQPPAAGETLLPFGGGAITTSTRYDANGRVTELVDDRGSVTRYEYDSLDRRTRMIFHDGATRQYSYNEAGDVVGYIDENGSEYENTFDALGRRTQCTITKASGVIGTDQQTAQYDGLSRATFSRDSISSAHADVAVVYDSLGRVVEDKQTFDGNTRVAVNEKFTSYSATQFKFPEGRQISNVQDALYRRTQVGETGGSAIANWEFFGPTRTAEVKLAANTGGANLYCTYMNNDRTRSAIQPGQTTPAWGNQSSDRLGYDAAGRLITKRYLLTDLAGTAYDSTSAIMGQTTAYDRASNKLYERALHAESRSHLYSSPFQGEDTGEGSEGGEGVVGYDSVDRLRQYQRGELATDGAAIDTPITLPNTNESRTYDLDGLGNWRRTTFTPVGGSESKEVR
ncbi:MAG: choice-of-anchor D domain-containing protein, partial [Planctomycetes bacterium]|nr:choice-of-anchor D domain-containing protein [Planctomycetota bacterium]